MTEQLNIEATTNETNAAAEATTNETNAAAVAKTKKPKDYLKKEDLTQAVVNEYLELRADGYFYWKKATVRSIVGDFAGSLSPLTGRYTITFKGTTYNGKDLSQFVKDGTWPAVAQRGRIAAPKLDAEGNPIVKEAKGPRVPRVAPVFTDADREAAKKVHEEKRAQMALALASRKAAQESKVSEGDVAAQVNQEAAVEPAEQVVAQADSSTSDLY